MTAIEIHTKEADQNAEALEALLATDQAAAMTAELNRLANAAQDASVSTTHLRMFVTGAGEQAPAHHKVALVAADGAGGNIPIAIRPAVHKQLAEKVGIDWKYYQRMQQGAPDLLALNVNHWFAAEPEVRTLRMFRGEVGQGDADLLRAASLTGSAEFSLRAFLGAGYRPIDHAALMKVILPAVAPLGIQVGEWSLSDERFYLKLQDSQVQDVLDLVRRELGDHRLLDHGGAREQLRGLVKDLTDAQLSERVQFGSVIRNSETGFGAFVIEDGIKLLICQNGAIVTARFHQVHLGKRNDAEAIEFISDQTRRLDNAALFAKARDRVLESFSDRARTLIARSVIEGKAPMDLPKEQTALQFVRNVGATFDLTEKEQDILTEETAKEIGRGLPFSRFTVSQGFTALARRLGEAGEADRKYELEHQGWKLLTDPASALVKAAKANTN